MSEPTKKEFTMDDARREIRNIEMGEYTHHEGGMPQYKATPLHRRTAIVLTALLQRAEQQDARIKELEREARYREELTESRD